jgi:hypothetical protein
MEESEQYLVECLSKFLDLDFINLEYQFIFENLFFFNGILMTSLNLKLDKFLYTLFCYSWNLIYYF